MSDFQPDAHEEICIQGMDFVVMPDPESKDGFPNEQSGKRGTVYELGRKGNLSERWALKVFNSMYRLDALSRVRQCEAVSRASVIPGFRAAERRVLTPQSDGVLVQRFPTLQGALLMPYIAGRTWGSTLERVVRGTLSVDGVDAALTLGSSIAAIEQNGWAHTDLASGNLMVAVDPSTGKVRDVQLIDLEEMYFSDAPRPRDEEINCGTESYRHPSLDGRTGIWTPAADRFALAVLMLEMIATGTQVAARAPFVDDTKSLFGQDEWDSRDKSRRVSQLIARLPARFRGFGNLFLQGLLAPSLHECPPASSLANALRAPTVSSAPPAKSASSALSGARPSGAGGFYVGGEAVSLGSTTVDSSAPTAMSTGRSATDMVPTATAPSTYASLDQVQAAVLKGARGRRSVTPPTTPSSQQWASAPDVAASLDMTHPDFGHRPAAPPAPLAPSAPPPGGTASKPSAAPAPPSDPLGSTIAMSITDLPQQAGVLQQGPWGGGGLKPMTSSGSIQVSRDAVMLNGRWLPITSITSVEVELAPPSSGWRVAFILTLLALAAVVIYYHGFANSLTSSGFLGIMAMLAALLVSGIALMAEARPRIRLIATSKGENIEVGGLSLAEAVAVAKRMSAIHPPLG